jgi:hypothetical protein
MIFGISPTRKAVVIAQARGSREPFSIHSIKVIECGAQSATA